MKQKHLAVALSAIFAAAALTGCGSDNDDNYAGTTPPVVNPDPTDPEVPEVPEVPEDGTGNNVGDAASGIENLSKQTTVGGQQYVRGATADFDKVLNSNSANSGNETVLNSKKLQNEKLDNILVGRETVERKGQTDPDVALRLAGEATNSKTDYAPSETLTLQEYNTIGGTVTRNVARFNATGATAIYYDANGNNTGLTFVFDSTKAASDLANTGVTTFNTGYPVLNAQGKPVLDIAGTDPTKPLYVAVTATTTTTIGNNIAVNNNLTTLAANTTYNAASADAQQRGLVVIDGNGTGGYEVFGQEDKTGNSSNVLVDGSNKTTKIFGNKSQDTTNAATSNSYSFTEAFVTTPDGNNEYENIKTTNFASGNFLKEMKLNHVQYGRVTSDIDKLGAVATVGKDGNIYYQSEIANSGNRNPNGTPGEVDTYFYRGTGETKLDNMTAFFDNKDNIAAGKVSYAGHAVMYGIDNSYHGNQGSPDTNAPGNAEVAKQGLGNLVQASVDIGDRKVEGSIFNVWQVTKADGKDVYRKDNLVTFEGGINGNTATGTSQLAYGSKDEGAFKGSFFGDKAQEFGGSVNSIDKGNYGPAAWGGVFGTQRVDKPIIDGNANQTE